MGYTPTAAYKNEDSAVITEYSIELNHRTLHLMLRELSVRIPVVDLNGHSNFGPARLAALFPTRGRVFLNRSILFFKERKIMSPNQLPEESIQKQKDFYIKLRDKINAWYDEKIDKKPEYADYILLVPDFFYLLVKLTLDERVPAIEKAKFAGTLAYIFSPIDFVPEAFFGPLGYIDDLVLACYVLNLYINAKEEANRQVVSDLWPGDQDLLGTIKSVLQKADKWIGSGALNKLKEVYETISKK
jgi:uncharacterized membrane protein YkvA (DUF1232 family)